jgi:hypothetical protein
VSASSESTPLYVHTLDSLCVELVSGRAVALDDAGSQFKFTGSDARVLFNWYRQNRYKWAQNNTKQDVEALVDQLDKVPPEIPQATCLGAARPKRVLHLKSMKAHRFAGIHPYGKPDSPPDDFEFPFEKPITLIEGKNGAGKTSLLNAICWCLTGHVYRSQRSPEPVADQLIPLEFGESTDSEAEEFTTYDASIITPIPSADVLAELGDKPLPLDTWVELTLVDDEGTEVGKLRRTIQRNARGGIAVTDPDFASLGLDPITCEVGTKMPGMIPYIEFCVACDLGKSVGTLTGIRPIEDLAKHAAKSKRKLDKDLVEDRQLEIASLDVEFVEVRDQLDQLIRKHSAIDPGKQLPSPGADKAVETELASFAQHFKALHEQMFVASRQILGDAFDPQEAANREDLIENVGPAIGLLDSGNLSRLSSAARLAALKNLADKEIVQAEALIETIVKEADELAAISEQPDVAERLRLYARVAGWIRGLRRQYGCVENCPVCQNVLKGKIDNITGKSISDHIEHFVALDTRYLEKTLQEWADAAAERLRSEPAAALRMEADKDLPAKPTDLISAALGEELFQSLRFSGALLLLKAQIQQLCNKKLEPLAPLAEPSPVALPACFGTKGKALALAINRVRRAIAFSRWRRDNDDDCKRVFAEIVGQAALSGQASPSSETVVEEWSLSQRLHALDKMVKAAEPLTESLGKLGILSAKLRERRKKEARIGSYERASKAIGELIGLKDLVQLQVESLMDKLAAKTDQWKTGFYQPAFVDAPKVVGTDVGSDGSLAVTAEVLGTRVPAHHVSNTSDLRATLLAFLLAFWQHLLEERGGLSLLLLDDLQELFDEHNRKRIANSIPRMRACGGRIVVTTNDNGFGNRVQEACAADCIDRREVRPLNGNRQHIELGQFVAEIDKKRKAFEALENRNIHQPARDYINQLRIYLEQKLLDLFDTCDSRLPANPTLSDLVNAVRARCIGGYEAFSGSAIRALVFEPRLANTDPFVKLINESHHGRVSSITYNDVMQNKAACAHVTKLVDAAHEEFGLWMRRDLRQQPLAKPTVTASVSPPQVALPIIENLAAFTSGTSAGEAAEAGESVTGSWFENCGVYALHTHNFGFSGTLCCRAIVDLLDGTLVDNSLVIALHKAKCYARRLHRSDDKPGTIVLASDAANPRKRPPSLFLPTEEVRVLKVVGILLTHSPSSPKLVGEAAPCEDMELVREAQIAFRVTGDSALPLALPKQIVLAGRCLQFEELDRMEGELVVIATAEAVSLDGLAFKRVAGKIPNAPHVRQFDSVGGLGESMLVRTEEVEDAFTGLPLLLSARRVLGVIYEDRTSRGTV